MQTQHHLEIERMIQERDIRVQNTRYSPEGYRYFREPLYSATVLPAIRRFTSRILIAAGTWIAPAPRAPGSTASQMDVGRAVNLAD